MSMSKQTGDGRAKAELPRGLRKNTPGRRRLPELRRSSSDAWQRKRVKSATASARRSKQSDRSASSYGKPLRRRASPARRHGSRPRRRVKRW